MQMNQHLSTLNIPNRILHDLLSRGYQTVQDVDNNVDEINKIGGIENWEGLKRAPKTETALTCYRKEILNKSILSFNENLDKLLLDLIYYGSITELVGLPGCGRTQLCMHLAVSVQLPEWCGGVNGEAIYISTNNDFSKHRLEEISLQYISRYNILKSKLCKSEELCVDEILRRVHYMGIDTPVELLACLVYLDNYLQTNSNIRLVLIDNITYLMNQIESAEKAIILNKTMSELRQLANVYKMAVVLTNNMTTVINDCKVSIIPALRDSFYHLINNRIVLSKIGNVHCAKLLKSSVKFSMETEFTF